MLELSRHAVTLSTDRFNSYPHKFWVYLGILSARTSSTGASSSSSTIPHDSDRSQRKNTKRRARAVGKFYDAGIVFGVLATLVSISLVILAGFQLILRVLELEGELERAFLTGNDGGSLSGAIIDGIPKDGIVANALRRRDGGPMLDVPLPLDSSSRSGGPVFPGKAEDSSGPLLTPLIPGITIPLWHIVPMLIALLICQVIHESGHALAAALSHIPPLSSGLAIMLSCMPSAFVAFPSSALAIFASDLDVGGNGTGVGKDDEERSESRGGDEVGGRILPLAEQLRIVTAGVWHNAVSVLVFLVAKVFMSGWAPASDAVAQSSIFEPFALILDYVYTISIALAVLNMLPLWDFDGEAFVERLALLLMRRRSGEQRGVASSAPVGPWNGYVGTSTAEMGRYGSTGRLGKRLLDQQNGSPQRSNGGTGNGTAGLQFSWPLSSIALTKSEQEGPSVRGRTFQLSGRSDDADLESGGGGESSGSIGRFSMTGSSAAGPTTVPNMNGVEGPQIRSDSILASPEETKVLRALRTRLRGVFGLMAVAVFGGTVVLEIVLAFQ